MPPVLITPSVTISFADPPDFTSLATILPLANASSPIERFLFRPDHRHSSREWALAQFQTAQKPQAGMTVHVLKAAAADTGNLVGFAILRIIEPSEHEHEQYINKEGAIDVDTGDTSSRKVDTNELLNHDFCDVYLARLKEIYERHMKGKKHTYWSTLMVLPNWQGRGVGSAMIRWALENLHLDTMPIFLTAQPDGYRLYRKFGWEDVEQVDTDLSQWAGPNKGYGMHRTVCMLRAPYGGAAKDDNN